jgi:hypothetical protein
MSSIKFANFIPIGQNICSTWEIPASDLLKFKQSASLKLGGTMNVHFARMMDRNEIWSFCTGYPIHHSCKVNIHCAS